MHIGRDSFINYKCLCIFDELVRVARRYLQPEIADMRGTKPKEDASKKLQPEVSTEKPRPAWMVQVCGLAGEQVFIP